MPFAAKTEADQLTEVVIEISREQLEVIGKAIGLDQAKRTEGANERGGLLAPQRFDDFNREARRVAEEHGVTAPDGGQWALDWFAPGGPPPRW